MPEINLLSSTKQKKTHLRVVSA